MKKTYNKGFTLVELSVVIAILALLSVPMIGIFDSMQKIAKIRETKKRLEIISNAISQCYAGDITGCNKDRLPCPTDITSSSDNSHCTTTIKDHTGNNNISYGAVPTKTLKNKLKISGGCLG